MFGSAKAVTIGCNFRAVCGQILAAALVTLASTAPVAAQNLSVANVQQIIAGAAAEATARGRTATIAVVDRVGNVLAVFDQKGTLGANLTQLVVSTRRGGASIPVGNGLENAQQAFAALGAPNTPSTRLSAITKAITGAYLSSGGNAFTTRTASQIVQEHFNPKEEFSPSGPLFGVQFSQLPCSDLSVRFATNSGAPQGLTGNTTAGPKRSPLGLSADPGGLPLYIGNTLVGGIGVEVDQVYRVDLSVADYDKDIDEIVALAGQFSFQPPTDIRAHRIFVEGKSLRYTDITTSILKTDPATVSFAAINGVTGNLVAVTGYANAAVVAGQTFGTAASGVTADTTGTFSIVGRQVFVLTNGTALPGGARFPPTNSTTPRVGDGGLTAAEVTTIISNALKVAFAGRAQIRRPLNSHIQVSISVVDADGNVLGLARTPDGPLFGTDVSLQKARTAAFFSNAAAGAYLQTFNSNLVTANTAQNALGVRLEDFLDQVRSLLGPGALANGIAFADRSGGNLARPFMPDGIDGAPPGPFSKPFTFWSPFNTGLQLDSVLDNIIEHINFADGTPVGGVADTVATCTDFTAFAGTNLTRLSNGFQIFPGSVPIYRNGVVIGGLGVSGDGIDQDDMISFLGLHDAGIASGTGFGNAPPSIRADTINVGGAHLRYVNCPFKPFVGSRARNVCAGK